MPYTVQKIHRLSNGDLFALAGTPNKEDALIAYLEGETDELPRWDGGDDYTDAILVTLSGGLFHYEGQGDFMPWQGTYAAFGSGADYAYGALALGASAEEAVRVAISLDVNSGAPIQVEKPEHIEPPSEEDKEEYRGPY
jgi:ATP-dependent protease HslVU (ClpYQ) peptidase subunit